MDKWISASPLLFLVDRFAGDLPGAPSGRTNAVPSARPGGGKVRGLPREGTSNRIMTAGSRGRNRVDVEDVPRLPTFPAAWTLADPRGRPYFVFWTSPLDDTLTRVLRMESAQQGAAVQVTIPDVGVFQIPIIRRPLPRRGGSRSSIGARAVPGRDATSTCAAWSSGGLSTIRATLPSM